MNIKLMHPYAKTPVRAHTTDAGYDLYALTVERKYSKVYIDFGVAFDIPEGVVGLVFPRSSIHKTDLRLSNSVGVIDSGYHGSVKAIFDAAHGINQYQAGDRCAQIVFVPLYGVENLTVVDDFDSITQRGEGGFGSTGV